MTFDKNRGSAYADIVNRICETGPISFEEFMEIALYSRNGYYSGHTSFGTHGDFYTSPSLHPVFGYLFAVQIINIWESMNRPNSFAVVEIGAGDGTLGIDIVSAIRSVDASILNCIEYIAIDRVPRGAVSGTEIISGDQLDLQIADLESCVVLSNELIDALPVEILEVKDRRTNFVMINVDENGDFKESLIETTIDELADVDLSALEGYRGPLCRKLGEWIPTVIDSIPKAVFINVDYGYEQTEYMSMPKSNRLLQTYYKHVDTLNPLDRVGDQDITAHVNFTALRKVFAQKGIKSVTNITQREWLFGLGYLDVLENMRLSGELSRREISLVDRLVEIDGLGEFRVEISQKGLDEAEISILSDGSNSYNCFNKVPPVTRNHMAYHFRV